MLALLFSLASWPSAGPAVGVLGFLMPTLALPQRAPNASPPPEAAALPLDLLAGCRLAVGATDETDPPVG